MASDWRNRLKGAVVRGSALFLLGFSACPAEGPGASPAPNCFGQPGCVVNTPDAGGNTPPPPVVPKAKLPCDVQDLLVNSCAQCHGQQRVGGAPMTMLTWDDLQAPALLPASAGKKVYEVVLERIVDTVAPMPQPPYDPLTADQVAILNNWVSAGTPTRLEGTVCTTDSFLPSEDGGGDVHLPDDDGEGDTTDGTGDTDTDSSGDEIGDDEPYVVEQSDGPSDCETYYEMRAHGGTGVDDHTPYTVPADLSVNEGNQYHCFYFKPPYNKDDVGLYFEPVIDKGDILHHWLLYGIDASARESGTHSHCSAAQPGAYLLAGWAPGAETTVMPDNIGMQMPDPTTSAGLILEVHYFNASGQSYQDRSGVKFCTAPKASREKTAAVHFTGGENICIPPGATPDNRGSMEGICDPANNAPDIHIINVWPHMHVKGRRMKIDILRANGTVEPLHDKSFNFNTQIAYPKEDVILKAGDRLKTTCYFENDTNAAIPFGERTQSEMCYGFITAWPAGALVTDPFIVNTSPINAFGQFIQPARRCLDPGGILSSCNGLLDYPGLIAN